MKTFRAILVVVIIGLGATVVWQFKKLETLRTQKEQLTAALAEKSFAPVVSPMSQADIEELERLRGEQRELLKLRGETAVLRRQLQEAQAAARDKNSPRAGRDLPEGTPTAPRTFSSVHTAVVPPGGAVLTGGWETEPGTKTFVFISPSIDGPAGQVLVENRFISIPDGVVKRLQIMEMFTDLNPGSAGGTLTDEKMKILLQQLDDHEGVSVLAGPRVITAPGRQAQVSIESGPAAKYASSVDVIPTVLDNSSVQMVVIAKATLPAEKND